MRYFTHGEVEAQSCSCVGTNQWTIDTSASRLEYMALVENGSYLIGRFCLRKFELVRLREERYPQ